MTILHVFKDEKFFDNVSIFFDSLKGVTNRYVFYTKETIHEFKYIHLVEKVEVIHDKKRYLELFHSSEVNIIYFHSLSPVLYKLFNYIDDSKIVIWWGWGFDIYEPYRLLRPIVPLPLYKPKTLAYMRRNSITLWNMVRFVYHLFVAPFNYIKRTKAISRIDYYTPVLSTEYDMICANNKHFFHAKPFMLKHGPGMLRDIPHFYYCKEAKNVLVGNSLTYTNNHLDILDILIKRDLGERKIILPVSYGDAFGGCSDVLKRVSNFKIENAIWLNGFLPISEYKTIICSVSHAIYGHIRQQAMGNVSFCFCYGVKVFLYKNSVVYKHCIEKGYVVYTIDDDLNDYELSTPLSESDARTNFDIWLDSVMNNQEIAQNEFASLLNR